MHWKMIIKNKKKRIKSKIKKEDNNLVEAL